MVVCPLPQHHSDKGYRYQGFRNSPGSLAIFIAVRKASVCHESNFANLRINVVVAPCAVGTLPMDVASLREKAALCLRIARGLSWNNPGRLQLTDLAERFERQAKEIDLQNSRMDQIELRAIADQT